MNPKEFLTALWGETPPGKILIWTRSADGSVKRSEWYTAFESVEGDMTPRDLNIYAGMSAVLPDAPTRHDRRYWKDQRLAAIPGLWADIDWADPVHQKADKLPPTPQDAMSVIDALPYPPTIILNSGHGYQAFWIFEGGPWALRNWQDQKLAAAAIEWWNRKIQEECKSRGWTCDSVYDLTRLMRVPGFQNWKLGHNPTPVTAALTDGPKLNRDLITGEAEEYRLKLESNEPVTDRAKRSERKAADPETEREREARRRAPFVVRRNASPPTLKFQALLENSQKFRDTWDRKRRDMTNESPSEYDLSLASQTVAAEWSPQESVDLMIAWRRKHKVAPKLRFDYYLRTLEKANAPIERETSQRELTDALADHRSGMSTGKEAVRRVLCKSFGLEKLEIIRDIGNPPIYHMRTNLGDITIGRIDNITSQTKFRNVVAECTGIMIPKLTKQSEWDDRAQALLDITEDADLGEASHPKQETQAWLDRYLSTYTIRPEEEMEQAVSQGNPFYRKERTHIIIDDFRKWLKREVGEEPSKHTLSRRLKDVGLVHKRVHVDPTGEKDTTRSCWIMPEQEAGTC